jgi:uncharacterized membrane-anchored protein YjiN (DUF445 family)
MDDGAPTLAEMILPQPHEASPREPSSLVRMRRLANGLLLAMTLLYIAAHAFGGEHPGWGYVRAFAEAAMVGALADWFAVTAIFRRPLGLPIPHTAVIPKNQGRIADALGSFIAENFLAPDLVESRVRTQDMAMGLGRWLSGPEQTTRLADGIVSAIPAVLDTLDDETVAEFLRRQTSTHFMSAQLAPTIGNIIEALAAQGRHQALLDAALDEGWKWLEQNHGQIRSKVRDRTGWLMRLLTVDAKASEAMIGALEDLLSEAARDSNHPLRVRVNELVARFANDLKHDPVLHARVQSWMGDILTHPAVSQALDAAWTQAKEALRKDCQSPTSHLRTWVSGGLQRFGEGLTEDETVRDALNERLRALIVDLAARHGPDVSKLVSDTIRGWDAATVVQKLEQNVGRDLQFIRLNGTIIGGLVGLLLHAGAKGLDMLGH